MKILLVHNSYRIPGGEDAVFENEQSLLRSAGHRVSTYTRHNDEILDYSGLEMASLAPRTIWAWDSLRQMRRQIASERPDVAHFHNTFPLISPSAYLACREAGVPVVQTLHNARLLCPVATLYRNGTVCEACVEKSIPWPAVVHGCYHHSRLQTGVVAAMLAVHRRFKTWQKLVDRYIASTEFFARKFVAAGIPADRVFVKPHFVARSRQKLSRLRDYALFVGRLAPEKGVNTLLEAWKHTPAIPLKIRGDGPLLPLVKERAAADSRIAAIPRLGEDSLTHLFQQARFLVWPSEGLYETFGLVAIEAFACGVPVIASNAGVMQEMVRDGITGLHFKSGNAIDLAAEAEWAWYHPEEMDAMGRAARLEYESKYTPERGYQMLMEIYRSAIEARGGATSSQKSEPINLAVSS
ncbi:MAG TPA: glycosyltransferase [Candidatus Acidoferrum sp.]|jgi:glycosyltransferase involved in cell wall biosynthesis|nr:glycosyltransferase [Candidatus Acidoferrum sp.]